MPLEKPRAFAALVLTCLTSYACRPSGFAEQFHRATGIIHLPPGVTELHRPLQLASGAHDLQIIGDPTGSLLRMASDFQGSAAIFGDHVTNIRLSGFRISGNRTTLVTSRYLPPSEVPFADYYDGNGVLFRDARNLTIEELQLDRIPAFAILVSRSTDVRIDRIGVTDSGTLNAKGHSNTTGGILLEQGTARFSVAHCMIERILGNGIWTHSTYGTARNADGIIEANQIRRTPRDAIQIGHAMRVRVTGNSGGEIGFPVAQADLPGNATPVALDTAGDVSESIYSGNHFNDVDGQCIDLDGFHDGQILDNSCVNLRPAASYPLSHVGIVFNNANLDMTPAHVQVKGNRIQGFGYGGIYLIGQGQRVTGNRFVDVNRNHCTGDMRVARCNYAPGEPGMLRSGIYLGSHAERPAQTAGNVIRDNVISGFGMDRWCVQSAPGVSLKANDIRDNTCQAEP